ncbi:MAG: NADPH:quinone oxidoreductase family protein [Novosphingobium sp.]
MKALLSLAPGKPDTLVLQDVADPIAGPGEVLVRVGACGVNFLDTLIVEDLYQVKPPRPFSPGVEVAGVVEAIGDGVTRFAPGDRVIALPAYGGMAEKVVVAQERAFALPAALDFAAGAGLLLTYGTGIHALKGKGRAKAGESLLVLGAGGGAGLSAVELGKALGLRVVAAVSNETKAEAARKAGADEVILYGRPPFDRDAARTLSRAFKAACGGEGADIVYDAVGGDYAEPALRAMAWGGRYLIVGFAAGIPALPFNLALLREIDLCGVFYGAFMERDPAHNATLAAELFALAGKGAIAAHVSETFPLAQGGAAIARLASRQSVGKVVVTMGIE